MSRHSPRGTKTEAGKHIITLYDLISVTHFYIFWSEEMYNYHPKFCYGTHTTNGQKVYFHILFLNAFLSSRVLD